MDVIIYLCVLVHVTKIARHQTKQNQIVLPFSKNIFLKENLCVMIKMSLKFVPIEK